MSELVHRGSTKDVYKKGENYLFRFSDRYSVFDWGEMPDQLSGKGVALAQFTKAVYAELGKFGIKHHLVNEIAGDNEIIVTPFEVVRDASPLTNKENVFIPLEVIFRMGVAKGSSLLKRFPGNFTEGQMFEEPVIEFTTKLERFDRPLAHSEAKSLSGLSTSEWDKLLDVTSIIAQKLKAIFAQASITLWDGKIELALGRYQGSDREIILVDSIGPDELRLTLDDVQLSKEVIRQYYRKTEWFQKLDPVKEQFGEDFKKHISAPPLLTPGFKNSIEEMYSVLSAMVSGSTDSQRRLESLLPRLRGEA